MSIEEVAGPSLTNRNTFSFITSQRNRPILLKDGYKYLHLRTNKDKSSMWRCSKKSTCQAMIKLNFNNTTILKATDHNHEGDLTNNEILMNLNDCEDQVKHNLAASVPSLYFDTIERMEERGLHLVANIPRFQSVKNKLYRKRNKSLGVQRMSFNNIAEIVVPEQFQDILLADRIGDQRILVFAHHNMREIVANSNKFFCDGTFKTCVKKFHQLFTIHVDIGSTEYHTNIIPTIYALLPDRTVDTYKTLFCLIKSQIPEWNPETITCDFEKPLIQALQHEFPNIKIVGCYTHFKRCLWRKAKMLRLTKSKLGKDHVKRCCSLPLLPIDAQPDAWLYIMAECLNTEDATTFNDYFIKTWLDDNSDYANTYNCYKEHHRTNNSVEAWNARIAKKLKKKPNILQFLVAIKRDMNEFWRRVVMDGPISRKKIETIRMNTMIADTVREFESREISIGHCIEKLK
ncbi:uncharacterized protein LOC111362902 [Spodoptera litura]|uniref:Uncharacterized protein LOC111351488 n=1 Tax=Spodoptera litura TaxID=69820 RepID=A0A9J7J3R9_SPOLT|nr:uncharacterized protein LOC111351488 [Spodoptera litura]XP_022833848.1 uncharacterized protein LOC111361680 [Spodoptera litura]XP_022834929.1 uncharacterized protein LOC111362486 [Spodoptera litura]XP_022835441.1 uncharacterized protein LOC111362902 [Spodoptera litura]